MTTKSSNQILTWLNNLDDKSLGKVFAAIGIIAVAVFSFALGKAQSQTKTEYVEVVKTVEVEKVVYQDRIVEVAQKAEVKQDKTKRKKVVQEVKKPDGTQETTTTETEDTDTSEIRTEIVYRDRIVEVEKEVVKTVEKEVRVETAVVAPDWRLGFGVRAQPVEFMRKIPQGIGLSDLTYTLNVDRRIFGPLFVGASVGTDLSAGLSLSLEF